MNNILVINGSPKGKNSITLHTCLFLEKKFPGYKFDYLDAGHRVFFWPGLIVFNPIMTIFMPFNREI